MSTATLSDVQVHYDDQGDGPALVFIHGAWSDAESWRPQVERFSEDHRTITYDLRGHGKTGASDQRSYSLSLFVDDLEALLDEAGIDRAVICGLSLGSMIAQSYLARHPERVEGIVLAGALQTFPPVRMPTSMKRAMSPEILLGASLATMGTRQTFRTLLGSIRMVTGGPWLSLDPAIREEALQAVDETSAAEFKKVFKALYEFEPPALDDVSVPALIVYGDQDAPPVKRQSNELARTLGGRAVQVSNAAHMVNRDQPEVFNDVLAEFLSGIEHERIEG